MGLLQLADRHTVEKCALLSPTSAVHFLFSLSQYSPLSLNIVPSVFLSHCLSLFVLCLFLFSQFCLISSLFHFHFICLHSHLLLSLHLSLCLSLRPVVVHCSILRGVCLDGVVCSAFLIFMNLPDVCVDV